MERRLRLRADADFARVRARGQSWRDRLLTCIVAPNGLDQNRYGFVVSKRVGKAVTRNLIKRRLREILRHLDRAGQVRGCHDCLFIVRPVAATVTFAALQASVTQLLQRANLLLPLVGEQSVAAPARPDQRGMS